MADDTPRLSLSTFDQGDATWDHTDTVETLDELAIDRGPISDRPSSGDYDDQLYFAVDQRILWRWDDSSSDWNAAAGLGSDSQRVPETTFLESIDVNTLADGSLEEQIDTAQLSNEAVTAAKIAAAAVKSDAIANDAVNSDAIASDQVTVDELAEALGTDSDNKIPGTTYFKKSSHEALEAESAIIGGDPSDLHYELVESFNPNNGELVDIDVSVESKRVLIEFGGNESSGVSMTDGKLNVTLDNSNTTHDYVSQNGSNFAETTGDEEFVIAEASGAAGFNGFVYLSTARARRVLRNVSLSPRPFDQKVIVSGQQSDASGSISSIQISTDVDIDSSAEINVYRRV